MAGRAPTFPVCAEGVDPEDEADSEHINAKIMSSRQGLTDLETEAAWQAGFERLLALAESITERDLLDSGWRPWLEGRPLALFLQGAHDHHKEHLDKAQH